MQVGSKLRVIENRLVNLLNRDVKTRLLNFLWQFIRANSSSAPESSVRIPNYLTHEDIAHLIGASRQTVTTLLSELTAEGIILYTRQELYFPDVKKLQKLISVV